MKFLDRLVRSVDTVRSGSSVLESRCIRNRRIVADASDDAFDTAIQTKRDGSDGIASPAASVDTIRTPSTNANGSSATTAPLLDALHGLEHKMKGGTLDTSSEIDAVVSCLATSGGCLVRQTQGTLRPCRIALFFIACTFLAILSFCPVRQTCVVLTVFGKE